MNEIKVKLDKVEYNCVLGLGFLGEIIEILDVSFDEVLTKYEKNPVKYAPMFMFHSISYGYELKSEKIPFELNQLLKWLDQDGGVRNTELLKFSQAFLKSIVNGVPENDEVETKTKDGTKKK